MQQTLGTAALVAFLLVALVISFVREAGRGGTIETAIEEKCLKGDAQACRDAAELYRDPNHRRPDSASAEAVLEAGCRSGVGEACSSFANSACPGGRSGNFPLCIELLEAGCKLNDSRSCTELGFGYLHATYGLAIDGEKAASFVTRACELGDAEECIEAGVLYTLEDSGVRNDHETARRWYLAGCKLGAMTACRRAAEILQCLPSDGGNNEVAGGRELMALCERGDRLSCDQLAPFVGGNELPIPQTQGFTRAWTARASYLLWYGQVEQATSLLDAVDAAAPNDPSALFLRAVVGIGTPQARALADKVRQIAPDDPAVALLDAVNARPEGKTLLAAYTDAWIAAGKPDLRLSRLPVQLPAPLECDEIAYRLEPAGKELELPPELEPAQSLLWQELVGATSLRNQTPLQTSGRVERTISALSDPRPEIRIAALLDAGRFLDSEEDEKRFYQAIVELLALKLDPQVRSLAVVMRAITVPRTTKIGPEELAELEEASKTFKPQVYRSKLQSLMELERKRVPSEWHVPLWAPLIAAREGSRMCGTRTLLDRARHTAVNADATVRARLSAMLTALAESVYASGTRRDNYRALWLSKTASEIFPTKANIDLYAVTNEFEEASYDEEDIFMPWFGRLPHPQFAEDLARLESEGRMIPFAHRIRLEPGSATAVE